MAQDFETFVLIETADDVSGLVGSTRKIVRIIRTYTDKQRGEEALALLRDAFEPDHLRQFDLVPVPHVDN